MRQVAGEPEQLQLERQRERIECGPLCCMRCRVERIEETRESGEGALVRLLLAEEPQHRLGADQADAQAVVVLARVVVRLDQLDARDRLQVAVALVKQDLDVAERLEPGTEPGLRLPDALRDGADPPAVEAVEVEDAVGLPQPHRPQDDRLGLDRAGSHVPSRLMAGTDRTGSSLSPIVARIQMYTTRW